uniref:Uncharacterized protein n=2 Tax=Grammatophora oceanica TaxID=210454 RepID=A0A7S1Y2F7_9STRA|mmetsp:Transcript_21047/g.31225  ORF Transcript_21047/g.31225 Transcript_21047/m.31225 type:complete len:227 (+) Transcript_21047:138-818(+)
MAHILMLKGAVGKNLPNGTIKEKSERLLASYLESSSSNSGMNRFQPLPSAAVNLSQPISSKAPPGAGRKRGQRLKSTYETSTKPTSAKPKKASCNFCGEPGHRITSCSVLSSFGRYLNDGERLMMKQQYNSTQTLVSKPVANDVVMIDTRRTKYVALHDVFKCGTERYGEVVLFGDGGQVLGGGNTVNVLWNEVYEWMIKRPKKWFVGRKADAAAAAVPVSESAII